MAYLFIFSHLTFSMILRYLCFCDCDCQTLDYINEGILLEKKVGNIATPLHYYADNNNVAIDTRYFKVSQCYSNFTMTLYSNGNDPDLTIPCTLTSSEGSILYNVTTQSEDLDQVSFIWRQRFFDRSLFCDTWALDDVSASLKHNGWSRIIYKEDFDTETISPGWDITNGIGSSDLTECSKKYGGCLYFDKGNEMSTRQALSPIITISFIAPVQLPIPIAYKIACNPDEEIL